MHVQMYVPMIVYDYTSIDVRGLAVTIQSKYIVCSTSIIDKYKGDLKLQVTKINTHNVSYKSLCFTKTM